MKHAKVKDGVVQHVWPHTKIAKATGLQVVKELPPQYRPEKLGRYPDCIVEVPDSVQKGWVWNGTEYAPCVKEPISPKQKPHSDLLEVVAEKLGVPYDELWAEVLARKKARRGTA